mmetsp:Transcript_32118/g.76343  ORF Transcript_32118/g.76343 Transcript_32118/m.76343 type:complete len:201 (+) Transcript_32118:1134-1736(+)
MAPATRTPSWPSTRPGANTRRAWRRTTPNSQRRWARRASALPSSRLMSSASSRPRSSASRPSRPSPFCPRTRTRSSSTRPTGATCRHSRCGSRPSALSERSGAIAPPGTLQISSTAGHALRSKPCCNRFRNPPPSQAHSRVLARPLRRPGLPPPRRRRRRALALCRRDALPTLLGEASRQAMTRPAPKLLRAALGRVPLL